jgi:VIT1/CCC1 family predicted Fe2+/Mn2+ transporter
MSVSELESWQEEMGSAYLYRILAEKESAQPERKTLFSRLAVEAEKQAGLWQRRLPEGQRRRTFSPDARTRLVGLMLRLFGPAPLVRVLTASKLRGMSIYQQRTVFEHAVPQDVHQVGSRHKNAASASWLRAAVFGANDGLVSNTSLILGVSGASAEPRIVVLSGVAGLLAGAFSMACGEYVSVRSSRELLERQLEIEAEELKNYPEEEAAELALIYEARGIPRADAERNAKALIADPDKALDTLAREELGLNPDDLGNPWEASSSSFVSFAAGAALPLIPFWLGGGLQGTIGLTATALFCVGAATSLFTGRSAVYGGCRMLFIGGLAGASTWLVGRWLGA